MHRVRDPAGPAGADSLAPSDTCRTGRTDHRCAPSSPNADGAAQRVRRRCRPDAGRRPAASNSGSHPCSRPSYPTPPSRPARPRPKHRRRGIRCPRPLLRRLRPDTARRHHRAAVPRRAAAVPGFRARLRGLRHLGPGEAAFRRRGADLRHHRHLGPGAGHGRADLLRHRLLPDGTGAAVVPPPGRHRDRTAGRHPVDHLRHVGLLRDRAGHGALRSSPG